jgi:hypothetical protein
MKYDAKVLARYGIDVAPIDDTMLMSYAMHAGLHGHGMDTLAERYLDHSPIPIKELIGTGKSADHLRPGGDRQGRALCRRGCRHHAAAVAPVQAAAAPGAGDHRLRDAGTPAGAGAGADGDAGHQGGPRHAQPHVQRLRPEDGGAGGRDPRAGGRDVQRRLAPSSWAKSCSTRWGSRAASGQDRGLFDRRRTCWRTSPTRATTCPPGCWTGGSCRSSNRPIPTRCRTTSTRDRARAHLLLHRRGEHRAARLDRSEPAEHPRPHRGRPPHPRGLRRRGGQGAGLARLFPDRAAHPRPYRRDRRAETGLQATGRTSTP